MAWTFPNNWFSRCAAACSRGLAQGVAAALICAWLASWAQAAEEAGATAEQYQKQVYPLLRKHCVECHGGGTPEGELDFEHLTDQTAALKEPKIWQKVLEQLTAGAMPPAEYSQPSAKEKARIIAWIKRGVFGVDCDGPRDPGRVTIRRLNRAEYNNTIRDLVGVDFRPADDFPADDVGYGFDNIGDVLALPPLLLEKYLAAAEQVMERAIVIPPPAAGPRERYEAEAIEHAGAGGRQGGTFNLYSAGEVYTRHTFPADGEYIFRVRAFGQQAGDEPARLSLRLEERELELFDVTARQNAPQVCELRTRVEAGDRRVGAAFVNDYYRPNDPDPSNRDRNLLVDYLEVEGPLAEAPRELPLSHTQIMVVEATPGNEREAARRIIRRFASRAFRRPATDDEVERLIELAGVATAEGEAFEGGIKLALTAVLSSPHFLFRVELDHEADRPDGSYPLNDYELASRLSYFLWSGPPDSELFALAHRGELHEAGNLEQQVRRMLADPKSQALVENFSGQWLQTRNLAKASPDPARYPDFDEPLRAAMREETERFFAHVLREDRSVLEFLDADYAFVNERLARHYGLDGVQGEEFRLVKLPNNRRGGVLTQATVLTVTSNPTRTSPVKRGRWVLENLLGTPPPPPPPGADNLDEVDASPLTGSLRQRMEQHREKSSCAVCHRPMDPLGFGLENFDAIGAWRERDGELPVDSSGVLPSGESFQGPAALRKILLSRRNDFVRCLTQKMLTYALGRGLGYTDECFVNDIVAAVAEDEDRFSRLILEIARSEAFQRRRPAR